jgi:hypothetical protein
MSNIIQLSKPCAFCDSRENVQLFAGLMLCGNCQDNILITNSGMFEANDQIEQKTRVNLVFLIQYSIFMYEKFFGLIIQVVTTYMIMKKKKIIFNLE